MTVPVTCHNKKHHRGDFLALARLKWPRPSGASRSDFCSCRSRDCWHPACRMLHLSSRFATGERNIGTPSGSDCVKFVKMKIPNLNEDVKTKSQDEIKSRMKERGLLPPRPWPERAFHISCTGGVFEPYVPPEGDGRMSAISKEGAKLKFEQLEKKTKSMMAVRKIRSYDDDFEPPEFAGFAQDIYIDAHRTLAEKNKYKLREIVTERAYPEMIHNVADKTIHWKFLKSLEPPRVVHARCTDVISKDNIFAQVTVRFHSQQILAIYDRFGRLMHGSETIPKDCLEYVVFEKHLSNEYGVWRLHEKIIPDWMPPKSPAYITYRVDDEPVKAQEKGEDSKEVTTAAETQGDKVVAAA